MDHDSQPTAAPARGAVAVIVNRHSQLLMHLRDDLGSIAWPDHWSLLGGGCDEGESPAEAIVRELHEEAGLTAEGPLTELCEIKDAYGSGQLITFFAATWNGDESKLPLTEGVKVQFFDPEHLSVLDIPPFIRDGIHRYLANRPA
ncbi:NUDIX domain-containing protein [Kitasatospora sp. LaBMicrA B282]|uniref:NUDIX domain-containing protein n=1 Tax=Kitasatospora sp. LaBMicrA B282 TaxID=3420949 RepID=UPI003D0D53AC